MMHTTTPATPTTTPLQVSDAPWPGDTRLVMFVQTGAPVGFADVRLGLGRGTKGKGQRPGDDPTLIIATLRRLAEHLKEYAQAYEAAYLQDTQEPVPGVACPCGQPTTNSATCMPF